MFLLFALFYIETIICFKYIGVFCYLGFEIRISKILWTDSLIWSSLVKINGVISPISISSYSNSPISIELKKKNTIPKNFLTILSSFCPHFSSCTNFLKCDVIILTKSILNLMFSLRETCSKQYTINSSLFCF